MVSLNETENIENKLKIAVAGNVDAGKSSLIGVLKTGKLDNGRGSARVHAMKYIHEKRTGRTSAINLTTLEFENGKKLISMVDLAGHEKYLKTTVFGLTGYFVDYGIVIVDANRGITKMTKEHMGILLYLKIPFIVLLTKIDMTSEVQLNKTKNILKKLLNITLFGTKPLFIKQCENKAKEELPKIIESLNKSTKLIPILQISNKTGHNIDNLKKILIKLKPRNHWDKNKINGSIVHCDSHFDVKGIGLVVSGTVKGNPIKVNGKYWIGPVNDKFYPFKARSLHNNIRQVVQQVDDGEIVCIAIRFTGKEYFERSQIKKGLMVFSDTKFKKNVVRKFRAKIKILNHSTTLRNNYQPVIHCNCIRQTASLLLNCKSKVLRCGDTAICDFEFTVRKEYLEVGNTFFFLDGKTKGIGNIIELIN